MGFIKREKRPGRLRSVFLIIFFWEGEEDQRSDLATFGGRFVDGLGADTLQPELDGGGLDRLVDVRDHGLRGGGVGDGGSGGGALRGTAVADERRRGTTGRLQLLQELGRVALLARLRNRAPL